MVGATLPAERRRTRARWGGRLAVAAAAACLAAGVSAPSEGASVARSSFDAFVAVAQGPRRTAYTSRGAAKGDKGDDAASTAKASPKAPAKGKAPAKAKEEGGFSPIAALSSLIVLGLFGSVALVFLTPVVSGIYREVNGNYLVSLESQYGTSASNPGADGISYGALEPDAMERLKTRSA
mmetsp:Transcript_16095/g.35323  ORF Transcript_16095/g.35323 Transcript_16095/m.35323 type:complete len:180 (+) Transcript_16095:1-540(+)